MPTGVEHSEDALIKLAIPVLLAVMPTGVEHNTSWAMERTAGLVLLAVMPTGVEHWLLLLGGGVAVASSLP